MVLGEDVRARIYNVLHKPSLRAEVKSGKPFAALSADDRSRYAASLRRIGQTLKNCGVDGADGNTVMIKISASASDWHGFYINQLVEKKALSDFYENDVPF